MTSFNLYEAYAAVYNEDLREDALTVEEDFSFIDELSDNELDLVMEEILSEKEVSLDECFDVFDFVLSEAKVTTGAGYGRDGVEPRKVKTGSAKVTTGQGSVMAAKERVAARKSARRAERVERIKSSVKRAGEKVKETATSGAAEAGRKVKSGVEKVKGKLASAKEKLKGFVKSGRKAVAGGLRGLASKVEPKETSKTREAKPYRGEGSGRKETVGKQVKDVAKEKIKSTSYRGQGVGRKETASSGGVSSRGGSMGSEGSKGKALPPVGKTKTGKTLTSSQRATQTAAQNRRLASRLGEDLELLVDLIIEDLINEGYAETLEEAFTVLESMSDYAVGDIAESYLTEETETTDLYDVVLEHLLDEGYADTEEAATVIMANMSEEWRNEILNALDEGQKPLPTQKMRNRSFYVNMKTGEAGNSDRNRKIMKVLDDYKKDPEGEAEKSRLKSKYKG